MTKKEKKGTPAAEQLHKKPSPGRARRFAKTSGRMLKKFVKHITFLCVKVIFFFILFIAVLGAGAWVVFVKYFNSEAAAALITKELQGVFGRPVALGSVNLKFFNSIEIKNLEVLGPEENPQDKVITVSSVIVHYEALPLLAKEFVIDEITLISPKFNIISYEDGATNMPEIKTYSGDKISAAGFASGSVNVAGADFSVIIKDWILKDGRFAFHDKKTASSYMVYNVDMNLSDLKFNAPSDFRTAFTFRYSLGDTVAEADVKGRGRVNMADFKWSKFNLRNVNLELGFLKKPVKVNFDMDNLTMPFISGTVTMPSVTESDLSLFLKNPAKFTLPETTVKTRVVLKENFSVLAVNSLNITAGDIKLDASGNFNFAAKPFTADINFNVRPLSLEGKEKIYPAIKNYKLRGSAGVSGKIEKKDKKFAFPQLNVTAENLFMDLGRFKIEKASGSILSKYGLDDISAKVTSGTLKVMETEFSEVRGSVAYNDKKDYFTASADYAKVDGVPMKAYTEMRRFKNDRRRDILGRVYMQRVEPVEFIGIISSFVRAISKNDSSGEGLFEGELGWMRDVRDGIPVGLMPNFHGFLTAETFHSSVLSGNNFNMEFNLTGLQSGAKKLQGTLKASMDNGLIYQLEKKAAEEKILGVAFQPFIVMHRMEKAGSFKVGSVLKDVGFNNLALSAEFKDGNMDIVNFFSSGKTLGVAAKGWVDWVFETLDTTIWTIFYNTSRSGALAENLTDASGHPALSFRIKGNLGSPSVEMLKPRTVGAEIKTAITKGLDTDFAEAKKFRPDNK